MTYVTIHKEAFDKEMSDMGFSEVAVSGTSEIVYERQIPNTKYGVRILSSIDSRGVGRDVGKDAVRITLWDYNKNRPVKAQRRVNRTGTEEGVLKRTRERARDVWGWALKNQCECGNGVMVERKGSNGSFLGCSNYPECKKTAKNGG
jgi:hypothetical protein